MPEELIRVVQDVDMLYFPAPGTFRLLESLFDGFSSAHVPRAGGG